MIFLSEWNNTAIALIFAIYLVPAIILFFITLWMIELYPQGKLFFQRTKKQQPLIYFVTHILLFAFSLLLVFAGFYFIFGKS